MKLLLTSLAIAAAIMPALGQNVLAVTGYYLKQRAAYHGLADVRTSSLGTKINAKELTIYQSPDGTATIFNNTNRKYCVLSRQMWIDQFGANQILGPVAKGIKTTIAGQPAQQYWVDAYVKQPNGRPRYSYRTEFYVNPNFAVPKAVQDDFCKLLGVPFGQGMPLRVVRHWGYGTPSHSQSIYVETFEVRPITVTANDFVMPTSGFTRAKDDMEVVMGETADELDALLSDQGPRTRQMPALRRNR